MDLVQIPREVVVDAAAELERAAVVRSWYSHQERLPPEGWTDPRARYLHLLALRLRAWAGLEGAAEAADAYGEAGRGAPLTGGS